MNQSILSPEQFEQLLPLATAWAEQEEARILAEEAAEAAIHAEELRQSDEQTFAGPDSPAAYDFGQVPHGLQWDPDQELAVRALLQAEGVPVPLGNMVGQMHNKALANPLSDVDRSMQAQKCGLALERVWGADAQKNLGIAQREFQRIAARDPRIIQMVDDSAIGDDPFLIQTVFNFAVGKRRA